MDSPRTAGTSLSAVEELLQLRANALSQPLLEPPLANSPLNSSSMSPDDVGQHLLSPSTVLPPADSDALPAPARPVTLVRPSGPADTARDDPHEHDANSIPAPASSDSSELPSPAQPLSAVEELSQTAGFAAGFLPPTHGTAASVGQTRNDEPIQTTVAPSELSVSSLTGEIPTGPAQDIGNSALPDAPVDDMADGVLPSMEAGKYSPDMEPSSSFPNFVTQINTVPNEFIVTLPIAANIRPRYTEAIISNRSSIEAFSSIFASDMSTVPDEALVSKIEAMFQQLLDLCDLPAWDASLPSMPAEAMKRHATGTNSKYSFVLELLLGLRESDIQVLILSRPGRALDFLEAVVATEGFQYRLLGQGSPNNADSQFPLSVTLAGTDQDMAELPARPDVVVAFDQSARSLCQAAPLSDRHCGPGGDTILSLVAACSLEHIDMRISRDMEPMERKNALVIALVQSRLLIDEPERGHPEPFEVAEIFAEHIKNPDFDIQWEPYAIPDLVFDMYPQPQPQEGPDEGVQNEDGSSRSNSRKRQMDDAEEGIPKRPRIGESTVGLVDAQRAQVSDLLAALLASHVPKGKAPDQALEVPLEQLESLAAKIQGLEELLREKERSEEAFRDEVKSLESQLKGHERSVKTIQRHYMEALRDRGKFEAERNAALQEAKEAGTSLAASRAEAARLKEETLLLQSRLASATAKLSGSENPDTARAAQVEEKLKEAETKIQSLERKVTNGENELQYARQAYQSASTSASELSAEKAELATKIGELEQRAGRNLVEIHRINAANQFEEVRKLLEEQKAIVKDRERELDRARDELRMLKNGRRETRQASVPRSPRMGVMSPRPGRGAVGGSGSRGTSPAPVSAFDGGGMAGPVPGMTSFFNQPPGNRWGHLRD